MTTVFLYPRQEDGPFEVVRLLVFSIHVNLRVKFVNDCSLSVSCGFFLLAAVAVCSLQVVLGQLLFLLVFEAEMSWLDWQCHGEQNTADMETEVPGPVEHGGQTEG